MLMQLNNELTRSGKKRQRAKAQKALKKAQEIEKKQLENGYQYVREGKIIRLKKVMNETMK
ncbi:hypothetical protein F0358_05180 [Empedobacter brevis]|uniref:hypothetical protein n=2 Tax=Empedobacter brevis TaxID=247 RepID=UPI00123CB19D|nr:hypothetical protein [Empedobacter brevis]QES92152.1 hypothetical protein F0358_05180 [Empedobacter brevis]